MAGSTIQYRYDGLNRLTERSQPAMSVQLSHGETVSLPAGTWRYEHDGLGRRTSKVELDGLGEPIESTRVRYLYGPEGLLHGETAPGGTTLASVYIWLNGEPIGLIRNDTLYHIHPDHLGRPEVITDASRNVVWRAVLYPWDRTVATTSIGEFNLGFPGQYRDAESGQWYNYFRTYDGSIGRYTQADPIGLAGGFNPYAYVRNMPATWTDATGLDVTVCYYSGGATHVGIAVNSDQTSGFYPTAKRLPALTGTDSGVVRLDTNSAPRQCRTIRTSAEDDRYMQNAIDGYSQLHGNYSLLQNNCTTFVRFVLRQGNIETEDTIVPQAFFNSLPGSR